MAELEMVNVSMEFDSQEEKEEHPCDICHVSYTTDVELRDHHWSLMHHIKMEKQKKGSVHNCTLCFMTCANIIEYGKHLNEEKHKRAIEDSRRQREEEDLLMGRDVLMARIREKEERERKKYQNKQKNNEENKNGDNNLSDPEAKKNKHVGKRRSERLNNRNNGTGHQRSCSLPGRNPGPQYRHPPWEHQAHNDDFHVDRTGSNFVEPSRGQWDGGYNYQQNQWNRNMGFQNFGAHAPNQNFHQPYDNGAYNMHGQYDSNGWTIDRRGMRDDMEQGHYRNQYNDDFYSDPNSTYELGNSGFPERSWQYGEPSRRTQDNHSGRGRNPNRWGRNNLPREDTRAHGFRNGNVRNTEKVPRDNRQPPNNGQAKDDSVSNSNKNGRPQEKNGSPQEKNGRPQEKKINDIHMDVRSKVTDDEVNLPFKKPTSPKSEKYIESMRESRNRSESCEKVANKRRRYNSPSHSHERRSRQDKDSRNTHIRFADDEISGKSFQHFDEADSTTSSGDKEELSSSSSGKKGSGGSKDRKKGILKKKKKNGGKGSPLGSPKRSNRKGREDKGGEGVLEKAEKLCRELREKREKAKLERERKMKLEQQEKLDNINQELKNLQDKSKEYVKGHILTEEIKLPDVSSAKENTEKESSDSKSTRLIQPNKEIEKIRQSIEKSVQSVNEIEKLQSSLGLERNSGKKDLSSSTNKSVSVNSEKSGKDFVRKETLTKPDSVETRKPGLREEISTASSKKPKEKPNTEALLKMVNSPRSRKERKQLAEMLRSYAQSQKKLSLPRYNLQLSGSYDESLDGRIEELRLEELSPEVQIQIAQLMEAEATPDLNDLEMALMSSSEKRNSVDGKSGKNDGTLMPNTTSARDQHHGLERVLQGSSKERQRTLSTDSDRIGTTVRRREDSAQPLKFSDLSTSVTTKIEPMDLEYEKAAQIPFSSPETMASHVTSTTNLGETEKSLQTHNVSVPRMPQFSDQLPQRSSTQMEAALPSLSGSLSSLESGRSTESFFDTVYDISVKEEALRKDLTEADQFIQYFRNVIEEASIQLNRYNEKKLRLQTEEEKLRSQRLRLLQEARLQQRSGQSTPQLSELEDQPRVQDREDAGKVTNPGHSSLTPTPKVSSYNDPHSSTLLNVLNRNQRLEPERDRQGCGSSFGTANSPVQANLNHPASDSILAQLRNLSSSLQQETISMETENKLDFSLPRDLGSIKKEPEEVYVSPDSVTSTQGPQGGIPTQSTDQPDNKENSRVKLGAARGSTDSPVQKTTIKSEPAAARKVTDTNSLPPKPVKSTKPPVNKKPENSDPKNNTDVAHSTELRDAGFITLNSLIKTSNLTEDIDSDDEPLANVMRRQRQDSLRSEDSQKRCESDDSASEGKKFNMRYMGTLGVDSKAFLTQLGKCQGGTKSQGPSYVVLDKDTDAYQQIQSLIKGGKNDKETSGTPSAAVEKRTMDRGTKSLRGGHVSDSNYESVNSNCSLGEQIRQYANLNKKGAKKKSEEDVVVVNTDSDSDRSDRTLQEDPALLSDSCTPVRMVKSCSSGLQNLNLDSSPQLATNQHTRLGREEEQTVRSAEESRSTSPFRKKLRTKKERDRTSSRKQKEDFVLDSSSDGGHSVDEDSVPKITEIKQQLVFKSLSNIPAALRAEGLDSEEAGLVETGSEDTDQVVCVKQEVSTDPQRRLLEDVQLESESEDNRQLAVEARERLSLDKEVMENFRKAVENMKSTLGLSALQTPEDLFLPTVRDLVQFPGPKEVISGLEVYDGSLYVSYQGKVINKFNLQTGKLDFEFNTMSHDVSCILVSKTTDRLYVGANEMMLLSYCCKTKRPIKVEPTEGKPQCFHENWGNLYMGTDCGTVVVMSLKNDKVLDTFHCADRSISRICSATEGVRRVILVASFDAIIYVYDSSTGLLIRMLEGHTRTPFSLQVDCHLVFSGSGDKTVMEHNISTGELLWTYTEAGGIVSCVCTHGDQLFCASYDRLIRCYNKTSRKLQRLYYGAGAEDGLIIRMTICDGMLITGNRQGLVEAVPISQDNHTCLCGDCDFVFAMKSHLLYHVVHCHMLNNVRSGKKTSCPWKNCKDKFKSTATKQEFEEHVSLHVY